MSIKLKVIKTKDFTANDTKHTSYTCAYKGRVFGITTLQWEDEMANLTVADSVLTISCDVEVVKSQSVDQLTGAITQYLNIVPKVGLNLAEF